MKIIDISICNHQSCMKSKVVMKSWQGTYLRTIWCIAIFESLVLGVSPNVMQEELTRHTMLLTTRKVVEFKHLLN